MTINNMEVRRINRNNVFRHILKLNEFKKNEVAIELGLFENRRKFMKKELGIKLKDEILPMSDICGYLRPLLLNREYAMREK